MASGVYARYLRSGHWKRRRLQILKRANGLCERCSQRPPKTVHHRSYQNLGAERDSELMAVCNPCHRALEHEAGGYFGRPKAPRVQKSKIRKPRPRPEQQLQYARPEKRREWWRKLTRAYLEDRGPNPGTWAEFNAKCDAQ